MRTYLNPVTASPLKTQRSKQHLVVHPVPIKEVANSGDMIRTLSGGFLTGKLVNNKHADTRAGDSNPLGKMIQRAFGAEDLQAAMKRFDEAVEAEGVTSTEVAIRWVTHHSALTEEDSVVLGASKVAQIQETMAFIRKGELPEKLLRLTEDLWKALRESRGSIC